MASSRKATWEEAVGRAATEAGALPPPAELTPLVCSSCGGPLSPALRGCAYCQAPASVDVSVRATMRRRAGWVERQARKMQSALRYQLLTSVAPRSRWLMRLSGPLDLAWLIVGAALACAYPIFAAGTTWSVLMSWGDPYGVRSVVTMAVLMLTALSLNLLRYPWAYPLFAPFRRAALRVLAKELVWVIADCEPRLQLTHTSRCGGCGAHLSSPVVPEQTTVECPYCQAPLVLTGTSVQQAAAAALGAAEREARVAMPGSFAERVGEIPANEELMTLLSYRRVGGIYQSPDGRVSVHHRSQPPMRIDVDATTSLVGRVVLLRTQQGVADKLVLAELGELPPNPVQREPELWAYLDDDVHPELLERPEIRQLCATLEPGEAVLLDGAGATFLRARFEKFFDQITQRMAPPLLGAVGGLGPPTAGVAQAQPSSHAPAVAS